MQQETKSPNLDLVAKPYLTLKKSKMVKLDRISNLPNSVLHLIFSFLDIMNVIQTSVLSKRWRAVWKSLPFLNFNYNTFHDLKTRVKCHDAFSDTVCKVLFFRDSSSNIDSIRLFYTHDGVDTWIHIAKLCNIQELDIKFRVRWDSFELPQCLLSCKSLRILKLNLEYMSARPNFFLHTPKLIDLPSLETLNLQSFCFHDSQFIQKFLLCCPRLRRLSIISCVLHSTNSLSIYATRLQYLEIVGVYNHGMFQYRGDGDISRYVGRGGRAPRRYRDGNDDSDSDSESQDYGYSSSNSDSDSYTDSDSGVDQSSEFQKCQILIYAPLLTTFKCRCYLSDEYFLQNLSSLVEAEVEMAVHKSLWDKEKFLLLNSLQREEYGKNLTKFLCGIYHAKSLVLSAGWLEVIPKVTDILHLPLAGLRKLKLKTWLSKDSLLGIKYFLQNYNLETLLVELIGMKAGLTKIWEYRGADALSDCNLDHLRLIEFRNVSGRVVELELFKMLLKNASVLENLTIFASKEHSHVKKRQRFSEKILALPKASSRAMILFF